MSDQNKYLVFFCILSKRVQEKQLITNKLGEGGFLMCCRICMGVPCWSVFTALTNEYFVVGNSISITKRSCFVLGFHPIARYEHADLCQMPT